MNSINLIKNKELIIDESNELYNPKNLIIKEPQNSISEIKINSSEIEEQIEESPNSLSKHD